MMRSLSSRQLAAASVGFVLSVLLAGACSSNDSDEAAPDRVPSPDAASATDTAAADSYVDPACVGADSCYKCDPQTLPEFLNACTDGNCTKFDNVARLPLYAPGQPLPPLP